MARSLPRSLSSSPRSPGVRRLASGVVFAIALGLAATPLLAQESISKVNGSVEAEGDREYGDLSTVNGGIRIGDRVRAEDADTVNGAIRVGDGAQLRKLETVNGGITLGEGVTARSIATVNGAIRAGRNLRIERGVETVSGSIFLDRGGSVGGDISTVNGGIGLVGIDVGGGIETTNGDVTVGVDSHVRGGLRVRKPNSSWFLVNVNKRTPRIVIGPNAVIEGELVFEREVSLYVHESARTGRISGAEAKPYSGRRAPAD